MVLEGGEDGGLALPRGLTCKCCQQWVLFCYLSAFGIGESIFFVAGTMFLLQNTNYLVEMEVSADVGAKKQTVGFIIKENKDIFGDDNLMFLILLICIPYLKCLKSRVFSRLFDLVIFL